MGWARLALLVLRRGTGRRGRDARSPAAIPLVGWRDVVIRTWRSARADQVGVLAAGIAFYAFLALLPLMAAVAMIYGLLADPAAAARHMGLLVAAAPEAAQRLVVRQVTETIGRRHDAVELALALLVALYGTVRCTRSITGALNLVYGEAEPALFRRRWGLPLALALGGGGVLALVLVAITLFGAADVLLPGRGALAWGAIKAGAWALAALALGGACACLYRFAPQRRPARWRWVAPGAVLVSLLWLGASFAIGVYLSRLARVDLTYGSLAAVVVLMLWLYLLAFLLLLGAKLNAEAERQTSADTTVGRPRPIGERDAAPADEIGPIPDLVETPRPR